MICEVKPKTYAQNFDDQLNAVEKMYGQYLKFNFCRQDILDLINKESLYSQEAKKRVLDIIERQMHKYQYLFYK